jgi:hypothetical protein
LVNLSFPQPLQHLQPLHHPVLSQPLFTTRALPVLSCYGFTPRQSSPATDPHNFAQSAYFCTADSNAFAGTAVTNRNV